MSKIEIDNTIYEVKLNKYFIKPHLMINGFTTDATIWENDRSEETKILKDAAKCYEYHKENQTLVQSDYHIHDSP